MRRTELWWGAALLLLCWAMANRSWGQEAAPQAVLSSQLLSRSGTVVLKVPDYDGARRQVLETAQAQGAELMDAKTTVDPKGRRYGWMHLRVSADRLASLLPAVQSVGKLYTENAQTTDNISQYEELARRVTRLQQHEGRLSGVLQSPRRMRGSDILYLQERLFRASVDESLLSQQRLDLERSAVIGTVTVELFEPGTLPVPATTRVNPAERFAGAVLLARTGLNHQIARAATAGAYALVFAPVWAPALLIAVLFLRWTWVRRHQTIPWLVLVLTRACGPLAMAVGLLRGTGEVRHQPIGNMTEEERLMRAKAQEA